jgi:hypothetical protein
MHDIKNEPGWEGAFTRAQAPGALANETRVVKARSEPGDATPDDTPGVILGSISHPAIWDGAVAYFVEWATTPRQAVAVMAFKVAAIPACLWCGEPVAPAEQDPHRVGQPIHYECGLRCALGSVGHQRRRCSCYGGDEEDPPGMTRREAARAAAKLARRAPMDAPD